MIQIVSLLCTFLWWAFSVDAIYIEEAFVSDWQLETIGRYECVLQDSTQSSLIVISSFESRSLLSYLNQTDGTILFRHPLDFQAVDAMMVQDGSAYVIKSAGGNFFIFDASSGFQLSSEAFLGDFTSSCVPEHKNVMIFNNTMQLLDADSGLELSQINLDPQFDTLKFLYADAFGALKLLYSTESSQYVFQSFDNGEIQHQWSRDESINNIAAHTFIDVPNKALISITDEILVEQNFANIWDAYKYRVTKNWSRFKAFLQENQYSPGKIITILMRMDSKSLSSNNELEFGLAKYLVVASREGVITALDVRNGTKIWHVVTGLQDIVLLDFSKQKRELLIVSKGGNYESYDISDISQPVLIKKDHTGSSPIESISKLTEDEYLVRDVHGGKCLLPAHSGFETGKSFIALHETDGIYGMKVKPDGSIQDTWKITVGQSEEIVAFANRPDEAVANIGVTLGNRTVLYKYLYPNLASYAVLNKESGTLFVNLVDTVTGELLYSQFHDDKIDQHSPINLVFGENWFVYSFFSYEPLPEQKLVVVELYESLESDVRLSDPSVEYDPLRNINKPQILSNAYFFPEVIKQMAVSHTRYQISVSAIIMELENGQITYLSKEIINARRKQESKMTDDEKKEFMAMPYISTIPLNDHFIITHSRGLLFGDNSQLVSIATNLESTSIVCDIGHDIFCTKIYPSGQFDTMSSAFEKGKLLATILGLFVLCYLLRPSVEKANLKTQWLVRN